MEVLELEQNAEPAIDHLVEARAALGELGDNFELNGVEEYHDAQRAVAMAAMALGDNLNHFNVVADAAREFIYDGKAKA